MINTIRVLFVEDDPEMAAIYSENFVPPEFESLTAANGNLALQLLQDSSRIFDFVVTDNYMPEMDGMTLLRNIHRKYPDLKVIIVTGYGNWSNYVDAYNMGVCKFLDKPVRMGELKELIRNLHHPQESRATATVNKIES